jgi:hypothetical protein
MHGTQYTLNRSAAGTYASLVFGGLPAVARRTIVATLRSNSAAEQWMRQALNNSEEQRPIVDRYGTRARSLTSIGRISDTLADKR